MKKFRCHPKICISEFLVFQNSFTGSWEKIKTTDLKHLQHCSRLPTGWWVHRKGFCIFISWPHISAEWQRYSYHVLPECWMNLVSSSKAVLKRGKGDFVLRRSGKKRLRICVRYHSIYHKLQEGFFTFLSLWSSFVL